jgi:hypothetical protein
LGFIDFLEKRIEDLLQDLKSCKVEKIDLKSQNTTITNNSKFDYDPAKTRVDIG